LGVIGFPTYREFFIGGDDWGISLGFAKTAVLRKIKPLERWPKSRACHLGWLQP
jgi:hypothetical protein